MKTTALSLVLVYLSLSGMMMVQAGDHAMMHQKSADHATQHRSFVCTWMCAAGTSGQSVVLQFTPSLRPSFAYPYIDIKSSLTHQSTSLPFGRAPPL